MHGKKTWKIHWKCEVNLSRINADKVLSSGERVVFFFFLNQKHTFMRSWSSDARQRIPIMFWSCARRYLTCLFVVCKTENKSGFDILGPNFSSSHIKPKTVLSNEHLANRYANRTFCRYCLALRFTKRWDYLSKVKKKSFFLHKANSVLILKLIWNT